MSFQSCYVCISRAPEATKMSVVFLNSSFFPFPPHCLKGKYKGKMTLWYNKSLVLNQHSAWFYCMLYSICFESCIQKSSSCLLLCFALSEWAPLIVFSTSRTTELVQAHCSSEDDIQDLQWLCTAQMIASGYRKICQQSLSVFPSLQESSRSRKA